MADRVGRAGVTGKRERLAAAAAEIDLAPRTACARLLHPGGSAEGIEGRRFARMSASECSRTDQNSRPGMDSAAWQGDLPAGVTFSDAAPATDAWLRKPRVIVGHDRVDDDLAVMPVAQFLDRRGGTLNLLGARHQAPRFFNAQP